MTIEGSAKEIPVETSDVSEKDSLSSSTYKEFGKNCWKALTIDSSSYTDDLASVATALGDEIETATANSGSLSGALNEDVVESQFGIRIRDIGYNAYESYFDMVEAPPSPADFPKGSDIYVVRSNYVDYIKLCDDRIASAKESLLEAQNENVDITSKDAQNKEIATIKQFIEKLEKARGVAQKHLAPIDKEIEKMEASA